MDGEQKGVQAVPVGGPKALCGGGTHESTAEKLGSGAELDVRSDVCDFDDDVGHRPWHCLLTKYERDNLDVAFGQHMERAERSEEQLNGWFEIPKRRFTPEELEVAVWCTKKGRGCKGRWAGLGT